MIAKYNGEYFLTVSPAPKLRIWRYTPVEGFNEYTYESGLKVFKKEVALTDIQEMFSEFFFVNWNGKTYEATLEKDGTTIALLIDKDVKEYQKKHQLMYSKILDDYFLLVPIDECADFCFTKVYVYPEEKREDIILSKDEWIKMYNLFTVGLTGYMD